MVNGLLDIKMNNEIVYFTELGNSSKWYQPLVKYSRNCLEQYNGIQIAFEWNVNRIIVYDMPIV